MFAGVAKASPGHSFAGRLPRNVLETFGFVIGLVYGRGRNATTACDYIESSRSFLYTKDPTSAVSIL